MIRYNDFMDTLRKRPAVSCFAAGALMTLALPPIGFFPVLFFSVPFLIDCCYRAHRVKRAVLYAWLFGCGYFILGLYWVSAAMFVDIGQWAWVLPLSLIAGPAVLALYWALIPLMTLRYRDHKTAHALIFVSAWSLIEYLRGHLFTGFPWNLAGYSWVHLLPVMQASSVVGIYGLSLLTLFFAALPCYADSKKLRVFSIALFILIATWGGARLALTPSLNSGETMIRIVQANIPQTMKWDPEQDFRNLEKHALLSQRDTPADIVVWPETAVTSDLVLNPHVANYISQRIPAGSHALLGNLRITREDGKDAYHNSVSLMDDKGTVSDAYDKFHLVPFGEYIPFRDKLNLTPIALAIANIGDFTPGSGNRTLQTDGVPPFSPLVCYEAIFPAAVVNKNDRPQWMVNVTNDGWYGKTAGPHQHFEIVRVRAIEEGLPLARAANTGISGMIDPLGRVTAQLDLGEEGTLDARLPTALPPTIYARYHDAGFFFLLALLMLAGEWQHPTWKPNVSRRKRHAGS
jgi:apolipoprotein N-acyltransferase